MNRFASLCLLTALTCAPPCFAKDARPDLATLLERMLLDSDMEAGKRAVELSKPGQPDAIPQLLAAIRSEHRMVRMMALDLLAQHGAAAKPALPLLAKQLEDPKSASAAVGAASRLAPQLPEAYALVVKGLSHDASARAAVFAIARSGPRAKGEVLAIATVLTRKPRLANPVGQALRRIDPEQGAAALRSLLAHPDAEVRASAAQALRQLLPATQAGARVGIEVEVQALSSSDPGAVQRAVYRLRGKGAAAAAAVPKLIEIVQKDPRLGVQAARTLGDIGAPATSELAKLLEHEDARVKQCAAIGLARMKGDAALPALPGLIELARSGERSAFAAIRALGPHAASAAPTLIELLGSRQRSSVEAALAGLGADALPALQKAWDEGQRRDSILRVLARLKCQDEAALDMARAALADSSSRLRTGALATLCAQARAGSRPALDDLVELLLGQDRSLRSAASRYLQGVGAKARPIAPRLLEALEEDHSGYVATALAAIGFDDPADAAPLVTRLLADLERELARPLRPRRGRLPRRSLSSLTGLRKLAGEAARPALPRLIELIEHEQADVREAVAKTLGAWGAVARPALEPLRAQRERETDARAKRALSVAVGRIGR